MASLPVRWIHARTFCQATEEESRVAHALDAAISGGEGARQRVEGQHGNPVVILSRKVENAPDVRATWQCWSESGLVSALRKDVALRVDDDATLHLRIDKQKAFQGMLALASDADAIDVEVKLKAYPAKPEEIRRVAERLVGEAP